MTLPALVLAALQVPVRILFIGNSLTYVNDVPGIVEAFARARGRAAVCRSVTAGGFSLEDHWNQGDAQKALAAQMWDYVVLQQGPSALPESREILIRDARRFAPLIRKAGARPALYMVWPSVTRHRDFGGVSDSYRQAARDIDGILLPAGDAWRMVETDAPKLQLYSADGLHPTPAGSYLAALVIYAGLFEKSPEGLPARVTLAVGGAISVEPGEARSLQEAAARAVGRREVPAR
jgi:hypothetical protein